MGVDISSMVPSREVELVELSGRRVAMDAYNVIYQFLSIIRDRMTGEPLRDSKGRITSHLSGLLYRNSNLLEAGIKPVFVFDGKPPAFKMATIAARAERKEAAEQKWKEAVAAGESAIKYAQGASRITDDMLEQSKRLLGLLGIPWLQAPSEGEMQCAFMCKRGDVWATGSQDLDSLMAGSPRLVRNLSIAGKRRLPNKEAWVQVKPELIELEPALANLGITHDQFVIMGMIIGTDFAEGVKGVGPKGALKLVKEMKTLDEILKNVEWEGPPAQEVFDFFKNPPTIADYALEWKEPDFEGLRKMMVDEHDFSSERLEKVVERLQAVSVKGRQSSLAGWLDRK
jgi:flap endonuclease-1